MSTRDRALRMCTLSRLASDRLREVLTAASGTDRSFSGIFAND